MPNLGDEVYLTDIEIDVMNAFVKRMILRDASIVNSLKVLINKLEAGKQE